MRADRRTSGKAVELLALTTLVVLSASPPVRLSAQDTTRISEAQAVLAPLIESYGVSGMESPVRETVKRLLPAWAKTETDSAGNLWLRVGQGEPLVVFVAHLDEIGFTVDSILDDGSLHLRTRGGFIVSLFEAQPALVHTTRGDVPGIFFPRETARDSGPARRTPPPLRVSVGTTTRAATQALGVAVGSTITMPKRFVRLAGTRATGRSMDDRVGSAAQILAVRHLDQNKLKHQVIFIWSTREEIGLEGAAAVAGALGTAPKRVHAIDTFVSADSPLELQNFAVAPIGQGPVARALDNSAVTPPAYVDSLRAVARTRGIALQLGTTNGGNDGSTFTPYGVVDVPMGWPLRYSHSPAEVVDLKDVASLGDLIQAIAEIW
jgi:putative aminopeptidase